jgi:inner membrane protein
MDSVSQLALGAAVGVAAMGRRTALWKAAAWGAVAGTLPDLDVFIDHGDAVRNMVLHRAETHAPFWLTLFSLPFAAAVAWLHGEQALWRRWWLALWLALVTHPLLDAMTVYGTQLALPFTNRPYGVGSIFIIDPLYTLPLLVGTGVALARRSLRANALGLVLSTAYLGWGVAAQQHVERLARASLAEQGIAAGQVLVTPTAFNSVLWRVLVVDGATYREGFYSLLDATPRIHFDAFDRGNALGPTLDGIEGVRRIADFSRGFYKFSADGPELRITDLRMGQEPFYTFSFVVARQHSAPQPVTPRNAGQRPDIGRALAWIGRRALGEPLPPPR